MKYFTKTILRLRSVTAAVIRGLPVKTAAMPPPMPLLARVAENDRVSHQQVLRQ